MIKPNKQGESSAILILSVLLTLNSCSTLSPPGTVKGGFHTPPRLPLTVQTSTISLTDRTGLPADSHFASLYLETLLTEAGYPPSIPGNLNLEISCRERSIGNSLDGYVSISAVLDVTDSRNRKTARFIYLGRSKDGLESDLLLYRILKRLIREFTKAGG